MASNQDIVQALGELSSVVSTGSTRIDRLAMATDEVADRVTKLETQVEERTRDLVCEDTLRLAITKHLADCQSKKLDRKAAKPSYIPRPNGSKAKTGAILGGAFAALTAAGVGVYKLIEFLQSLGQ